MRFKKSDCSIRWSRAGGAGGQHRNKTENCINVIHEPTGVEVRVDGRSRAENKRKAFKDLKELVIAYEKAQIDAKNKENRDYKIKNTPIIRTYNFKRGTVKDHRSGKTANLNKMLDGKVDLENFSTKDTK